jgi:hypothetical protein
MFIQVEQQPMGGEPGRAVLVIFRDRAIPRALLKKFPRHEMVLKVDNHELPPLWLTWMSESAYVHRIGSRPGR